VQATDPSKARKLSNLTPIEMAATTVITTITNLFAFSNLFKSYLNDNADEEVSTNHRTSTFPALHSQDGSSMGTLLSSLCKIIFLILV